MKTKKTKILILIIFSLILFGFFFFQKDYKIIKTFVSGSSMLPSFYNGQIICLYEDYYKDASDIDYTDVVGFRLKTKGDFIKRIIAVPGDKIVFGKDGFIYKNDKKLIEKYTQNQTKFHINTIRLLLKQLENYDNIIPKNMFLVMGDNRGISIDSTTYGLIDYEQILGKVKKALNGKCF